MSKYYLTLTTIFKNDGEYMKEWIDFHLMVGVEHFYLYDNRSNDNVKQILSEYIEKGIVTYTYWDVDLGRNRCGSYNDCLKKYGNETKWLGNISTDEFLYSVNSDINIVDVLKEIEDDYGQIKVNWKCFGDNFYDKRIDGGVIERFTKRGKLDNFLNYTYKSIMQPEKTLEVKSSHDIKLKRDVKCYYDSTSSYESYLTREQKEYLNEMELKIYGRKLISEQNIENDKAVISRAYPNFNKLCLNHYMIKSKEEFTEKYNLLNKVIKKVRGNDIIFKKYRDLLNQDTDNFVKDIYLAGLP